MNWSSTTHGTNSIKLIHVVLKNFQCNFAVSKRCVLLAQYMHVNPGISHKYLYLKSGLANAYPHISLSTRLRTTLVSQTSIGREGGMTEFATRPLFTTVRYATKRRVE
jgi:hypothetical protein